MQVASWQSPADPQRRWFVVIQTLDNAVNSVQFLSSSRPDSILTICRSLFVNICAAQAVSLRLKQGRLRFVTTTTLPIRLT